MRRRLLVICISIALLALPAAATASPSQESLFQDDGALVYGSGATRDRTLDELQSLGVDVIRTNVVWGYVAPGAGSKRKPKFDDTDPGSYALGRWDGLVQEATKRGFAVLMTITGPGPAWASRCGGSVSLRRICKPSPLEFGHFVTAVAKRYDGSFLEVPRVSRWSIWNEPNQSAWLYPQWARYRGSYRPYAPRVYRDLAYAAIGALRANGHAGDHILLGETAPIGRRFGPAPKRSLSPSAFIEGVFCMDSRGHTLHGANAAALGCGHRYQKLLATGYAHHPYTRGAGHDPRSPVASGDITLGTIGRLQRELHRGAHLRRIRAGMPIYLTEYGVQTDPPDRSAGVPLSVQANWLNESDWLAYRNRAIRSVSQYELFDDPGNAGFQTGLRFKNGKPKPSLAAYRLPLWVTQRGSTTTIWGQVRPGGIGSEVDVLYQPKRHAHFRVLKTLTVRNPQGFFTYRTHRRAYRWRVSWHRPHQSSTAKSRVASPAR